MNKTLFFGLIGGLMFVGPRLFPTATFSELPKNTTHTCRVVGEEKPLRRVQKTTAEWKKILTSDQFAVTR